MTKLWSFARELPQSRGHSTSNVCEGKDRRGAKSPSKLSFWWLHLNAWLSLSIYNCNSFNRSMVYNLLTICSVPSPHPLDAIFVHERFLFLVQNLLCYFLPYLYENICIFFTFFVFFLRMLFKYTPRKFGFIFQIVFFNTLVLVRGWYLTINGALIVE